MRGTVLKSEIGKNAYRRSADMRIAKTISAIALLSAISGAAWSADFASKDEAVAMVKKAVDFIKQQGADKAYTEIDTKGGQFTDRDLYVVVYGLDGKVLAHGANQKLIGKDMIEAQDVDGKYFVKERVDLAQKEPNFWQDYKFVNPESKKIEPKQMYCERLEQTAVCAGVYKG
jgi:cytochrome c